MSMKGLVLSTSVLFLASAVAAQAGTQSYSLAAGSGGQLHIGNGLALPIQAAAVVAGTVFPPLLIPRKAALTYVEQTTTMSVKKRINIPAGVLSKKAALTTVGVRASNPAVYAVATNLKYTWPAAPAVLSTLARTGLKDVVFLPGPVGQSITYSNPLSTKFGGPAQFKLTSGGAAGILAAPVTVWIAAFGGLPPCTHPNKGGVANANNLACKARLAQAKPSLAKSTLGGNVGHQAIGGPVSTSVTTPGGTVGASGVRDMKLGAAPLGTIVSSAVTAAMGVGGINNKATSAGYPWTTGKIVVKASKAGGSGETFILTGKDLRTAMGAGTIQLVAGSLSQRTTSMDNANRGWLRLVLAPVPAVPALSDSMRVAVAVLMALTFGYAVRRFAKA